MPTRKKKKYSKFKSVKKPNQLKNNKQYMEQICEVLVENKLKEQEKYFGRTKSMIPVKFESNNCKPGDLVNVKITSFNQNTLFGYQQINKMKAA